MAKMSDGKDHSEGSVNAPGIKGVFQTSGGIITNIEGLSNDAGCGKPPGVGTYGKPSDAEIPTGEKMPSGTGRAIKAFFKGMGGGKP